MDSTKRGRDDGNTKGVAGLPAAKKPNLSTPQPIDIDELMKERTPERIERIDNGIMKVATSHDPGLCGGDWVCSKKGDGVTLSFVFTKDGKDYGLTVAHGFESLSDKVYSFLLKDEVECESEGEGTDGYKAKAEKEFDPSERDESFDIFEIGKVVSLSRSTDSMVFEFNTDVEVKPELTVKLASGLTRVIKLPQLGSEGLGPPPVGTTLVGFGARHRGFRAVVEIPSTNETHQLATVPSGSICIANQEKEVKRITYDGDCGTILMDLECNGVYFHTEGTALAPWKSFGASLSDVMRHHSQLGGTSVTPEENGQRNDSHVEEGRAKESFPIPAAKFNVHVVPPPARTVGEGAFKIPNVRIVPNPCPKKK
jgi:hypothetical protein